MARAKFGRNARYEHGVLSSQLSSFGAMPRGSIRDASSGSFGSGYSCVCRLDQMRVHKTWGSCSVSAIGTLIEYACTSLSLSHASCSCSHKRTLCVHARCESASNASGVKLGAPLRCTPDGPDCRRASSVGGSCLKWQKLIAIERVSHSEPASAAPSVPDEIENAVPVFRPKFGPEMTTSIGPAQASPNSSLPVKRPMFVQADGTPSTSTHSPISPRSAQIGRRVALQHSCVSGCVPLKLSRIG